MKKEEAYKKFRFISTKFFDKYDKDTSFEQYVIFRNLELLVIYRIDWSKSLGAFGFDGFLGFKQYGEDTSHLNEFIWVSILNIKCLGDNRFIRNENDIEDFVKSLSSLQDLVRNKYLIFKSILQEKASSDVTKVILILKQFKVT